MVKLHLDPDDYELAEKEAASLESYDHPNIVKFIEGFDYDFIKYAIVMEYCEGRNHKISNSYLRR